VESGSGAGAASIFVPRPSPTPDLLARSDEPNGRDGESRVLPQREAAEPQAGPRELPLPDGLSAGVLDASPVRRLVIPALKLDVEVVDAPFVDRTWDISELGGKVAWLTGTSWPGQMGNTALAGHITARRIGEGPFRYLHRLRAGDPVYVYTADYLYTYRVREQVVVKIEDVHVLAPTDSPQLTLLTCTDWDEKLSTYRNRRVVFADLVSVAPVLAGQ
jgi:sortase A